MPSSNQTIKECIKSTKENIERAKKYFAHLSDIQLNWMPLGLPQVLIVGALDTIVPPEQAERYAAAAAAAGEKVRVLPISAAGHFELVVPGSVAWPSVRDAVL